MGFQFNLNMKTYIMVISQLRIFWKFEENVKKREFLQNMNKKIKIETETPCDPGVIRCSVQSSNG